MNKRLKIFARKFLDIVYPFDITCAVCGEEILTKRECGLCSQCFEDISLTSEHRRDYESLPVYSYAYYEGTVRNIVISEKDNDKPYLVRTVAYFLNKVIKINKINFDYIAYVPTSKSNISRRGYDAIKFLATELSFITDVPILKGLKRIKNSMDQTQVEKEERKTNISGCFMYRGEPLYGKTVLLVDDVVTTGATLNECAEALKAGLPSRIIGLTLCRVKHSRNK